MLENSHNFLSFLVGDIDVFKDTEQPVYVDCFRDITFQLCLFLGNSFDNPTRDSQYSSITIGLTSAHGCELFPCFLIYDSCVPDTTVKGEIERFPAHVPLQKLIPKGVFGTPFGTVAM